MSDEMSGVDIMAGSVVDHAHVTLDEDVFWGYQNLWIEAGRIKREGMTEEGFEALIHYLDDLDQRLALSRFRSSMDPRHHNRSEADDA